MPSLTLGPPIAESPYIRPFTLVYDSPSGVYVPNFATGRNQPTAQEQLAIMGLTFSAGVTAASIRVQEGSGASPSLYATYSAPAHTTFNAPLSVEAPLFNCAAGAQLGFQAAAAFVATGFLRLLPGNAGDAATPPGTAPSLTSLSSPLDARVFVDVDISNIGSFLPGTQIIPETSGGDVELIDADTIRWYTPPTGPFDTRHWVGVTVIEPGRNPMRTRREVTVTKTGTVLVNPPDTGGGTTPATEAPTLAGFPGSANEGTTVTGSIAPASGGAYPAGTVYDFRTSNDGGLTFGPWTACVNSGGGQTAVRVNGSTVSYDLPVIAGDSNTQHRLQLRAAEPGKTVSGGGNIAGVTGLAVIAGQPTTATPVLSGFPASADEGTTVTGNIAPTGGGSYGAAVYDFRTSNDGGATFGPWTPCVNSGGGQTAVRVSGSTVSYDIPLTAGDSNTQHRLEMRVTESGKNVSAGSNTVGITGNAVVAPTQTAKPALYGFARFVNEGTSATGRIEPDAGGSYGTATYEYSLNGGSSWTPCVNSGGDQTPIRVVSGVVTVDVPSTAGNNDSNLTFRMRVTESGKNVSVATGDITIIGRAVIAPDFSLGSAVLKGWYSFPLCNSNDNAYTRRTVYGASRVSHIRDLANNNGAHFAWNADMAPLAAASGLAGARFETYSGQLRLTRMLLRGWEASGSMISGTKAPRDTFRNASQFAIIALITPVASGASNRGVYGMTRGNSSTSARVDARITGPLNANQFRTTVSNNDGTPSPLDVTPTGTMNPNSSLAVFEWAFDMTAGTVTCYRNGTQVSTGSNTIATGALANTDAFQAWLGASIVANAPTEGTIHELMLIHGSLTSGDRSALVTVLNARTNA